MISDLEQLGHVLTLAGIAAFAPVEWGLKTQGLVRLGKCVWGV